MTDLTSAQLSNLTAALLGEQPARAANKDKALGRLIATAEGHGLQGIKKIVALPYAEALAKVEAHAAELNQNADRPGDEAEAGFEAEGAAAQMEAQAEATTKPRRRKPTIQTEVDHGPSNALIAAFVAAEAKVVGIKLISERFGTYAVTIDGLVPQGAQSYDETRAIDAARALVAGGPDTFKLAPTIEGEATVAVPVSAPAKPGRASRVAKVATPADLAGKAWFRSGEAAEVRMLAVMIEVGPAKLAAFRAKFAEGQDQATEFEALSQTQQNGILIRAMDKLMAAGKLTRDGLVYGVKEEFAKAA